jgi:hypothetical protein
MTMTQRAASRRGPAAVACLALVAGLIGGLASPAGATDGEAEFDGLSNQSVSVRGSFDGGDSKYYEAGLLKLLIDGSDEPDFGYCIDFFSPIHEGDVLDEGEWASTPVENRDTVGRILGSYHPIGVGPEGYEIEGTDAQKAAGTQAAIWHFTNGFELEEATGDPHLGADYPGVYANYLKILDAVADDALPQIGGTVSLSIEGDTEVEALPGELVGPFTVHTSVASVELIPGGGATIHDESGAAFDGPASDGDQFWITSADAGAASVSAVAAGVESGVRVFTETDLQDMALLVVTPKEVPASIEVNFTTPPTTPSTTATTTPESTTTVPVTSTTSVAPSTTVTTTPPRSTGGSLPVTGAQTLVLVGVALALVAAGVGFGIVSRRSRGEA